MCKKSRFIKKEEAIGLLSNLEVRTSLSKIPILDGILLQRYKMKEIINKFLLAGDKFMSEMHLRQSRSVYIACGPFTKIKEKTQKFKEPGDSRYIYQNELYKAWFQRDTAYRDFTDLHRRTASDKVLRDKAFSIAKNQKYYGYQHGHASVVYKIFDKKSAATRGQDLILKTNNQQRNYTSQLLEHFKKVYSYFKDNIWGVDLL